MAQVDPAKGAEEISTHTGDVAHIVADIVCDARRVPVIILLKTVVVLAGGVRAHVRGLCVDAAAHTAEERDGGAAQAVAGDGLVHGLLACEVKVLLEALHEPPTTQARRS